jgi:hypothetical protein
MTKDDFFEKCLDIISTEGYPKAGISYIKLKSGEEGFLSGSIFHGLNPSEIAMFLLILAKDCDKVYVISPLFDHGLLRNKLAKISGKTNNYMSLISANYENTTDLSLLDLDYPKFNKDEYDINDECFSFNEKTKKLVRADLLSDINKDIIYNEIQQKLIFANHWRKYYSRAKAGNLEEDNAIGENILKDDFEINDVIKNHYYTHYNELYKSIKKLTDGVKKAIQSQEEDSEGDDFLKNLMNQLSKKDEDLLQDDINELKNKKNKKEDDEQSKSKLDSKSPKPTGNGFLSKIKRKFK